MDGDEKIRLEFICLARTILKRNPHIAVACIIHFKPASRQQSAYPFGQIKGDFPFQDAVMACAWILAAVAGVNHDASHGQAELLGKIGRQHVAGRFDRFFRLDESPQRKAVFYNALGTRHSDDQAEWSGSSGNAERLCLGKVEQHPGVARRRQIQSHPGEHAVADFDARTDFRIGHGV